MYRKQRKTDPTYEWKRGNSFLPKSNLTRNQANNMTQVIRFCHHNRYLLRSASCRLKDGSESEYSIQQKPPDLIPCRWPSRWKIVQATETKSQQSSNRPKPPLSSIKIATIKSISSTAGKSNNTYTKNHTHTVSRDLVIQSHRQTQYTAYTRLNVWQTKLPSKGRRPTVEIMYFSPITNKTDFKPKNPRYMGQNDQPRPSSI